MIPAHTLMLGNLVLVEHLGKEVMGTIEWIQKESLSVRFLATQDLVNGVVTSEKKLIPIPLTNEFLEHLGFEALTTFNVMNIRQISLGRDKFISVGCIGSPNEMVFIAEEDAPEVKSAIVARNFDYDGKTYVHHIQNLYTDLTNGKELSYEIKESMGDMD